MNVLNQKFRHTLSFTLFTVIAVAMSACNGSSGPAVQQGQIVDTAVAGVAYSTTTQSGITDANGSFTYIPGETIAFAIGEFEFASIPAKATINWFELGGLADIPVGIDEIDAVLYDEFDLNGDGVYDAPSLSRVAAIASLLTTMDDDRDSANGIVIASDVAALMTADIDVDLSYASSPRWDGKFRRVIRQAAFQGLMPAREVRNGSLELAALYQRVGIDPGYKVSTRNTRDNNADGIDNWVRILTYDPATARVVRDEYDTDNDGLIDNVFTQAYTAELMGDLYTRDVGNDGVENTRDWDHDAFGDLTRYEETRDGTLYQVETRELDPGTGLYTRREVINPVTGAHTIETWTMDGQGNRPIATIDYDGDGNPENTVTLSYDGPNSPWTGREDDTDGDGAADILTTRTFNADGSQLSLERDDDADGSVDYIQEFAYDGNGFLISDSIDDDNDGLLDAVSQWQRDGRGRILSSSRRQNGVLTFSDEATYNNEGQRLTYFADRDGDGSFDDSYFSSYDANNNLTESRYDRGADGVVDTIDTRIYDSNARLIETQRDSNADGVIDSNNLRSYDADGYIISQEGFRNGVATSISRYLDYIATSIAGYL